MKRKDPNKELIQYVEDTGFYKASARLEMDAYLEKERGRQKETGNIGTDNVKIDVREAARNYDIKPWQKIFVFFVAVILLSLIAAAVAGCIIMGQGKELPAFLGFLEHPIDYFLDWHE